MADFRGILYTCTFVALLAGLTVPANAQGCFGTANNPLVRGEDSTALTGDIFVSCSGGIPTTQGSQVPKANITVFTTGTTITSKITDASVNPAFNEALLIIDGAGETAPNAPGLLNCGNDSAPYGFIPYTCDIAGTGTGTGVYDGTFGHPNVFQGRQVAGSDGTAIQFIGVPLDAAGTSRRFRIVNLRVNAAALASPGFVQVTVTFSSTNFGPQNISVVNGTVRAGLVVATSLNANPANFQPSAATAGNARNDINLTEGFPTAFRVRNWRQIQDNGTIGCCGWNYNGTAAWDATDLNQNVPDALYNTESGLLFPPGLSNPSPDNPPLGTSSAGSSPAGVPFSDVAGSAGGVDKAGTVSQGTRLAIRFSSAPAGSNPSVPNFVNLTAGGETTGVMALVLGADANGAGGSPTQVGGSTLISTLPGGLAVYEILFSNPDAIETATVTVTVAPTGTPEKAGLTATASFAPFYSAVTGANLATQMTSTFDLVTGSFPVPRFLDTVQGPFAVYDYNGGTTSVADQIEALESVVQGLSSPGGHLNKGQAGALLQKLEHVLKNLNTGKTKVACNLLPAFVAQVNSFVAQGLLTATEGNSLTAPAQAISQAIPCPG